uniref:GATA-type domain-containing protein n=1 Tax=Meloidogyne enterolobii TaxID=390850 RepID=A0A6V7UVK9_MELEN|nr:unnamed protein product [Meloidogyne enterolobii]
MIKFNSIILIYLIIFLKIQCAAELINVEVKIKNDRKEKREFIYLKNVEIKDRFVLKVIEKKNNQHDGLTKNIEGFLRSIDLNINKNMFEVEIRVLRNNNFIENNNCYETSILFKFGNNLSSVEENIENYKNKLLSSYWTEINLIGYKIELLEKQKFEYPKEFKSRIIEIGNKIRVTMEKKNRDCFNCGVKEIKNKWHKYLKEQYLSHNCGDYIKTCGKHRNKSLLIKTKKDDRKCFICDVTQTSQWHRYSIPGHNFCAACYKKQQRINKSNKNTKID